MTGSQTFPSLTRGTLDEHQQIHFFLDQLARSLRGLEANRAEVEILRRLAAQIGGLRERLEEHFGGEDDGGLFRAVVDLLPDARSDVQQLSQEHRRILEMLEMARIRAEYGQPSEAELLRVDLETFLGVLRDHERREEALLVRGLEQEAHHP